MLEQILTNEERECLRTLLDESKNVVVTCHVNPDGDAIGSMTAMLQLLTRMGKEAVGVVPNGFPDHLKWMEGASALLVCGKAQEQVKQLVDGADIVFCMDYNGLGRIGAILPQMLSESKARKVMIDHHLDPEDFCDLTISHPYMCSTCEVLLHVANEMGWGDDMTTDEAASLYAGMMTDTGAFTYASSRPEIYECISFLLRKGIDKDKIYRDTFWTCTEGKLRLMGYMLYVKMDVLKKQHAALLTLTNKEYRRFPVKNGDTEGLVNMPLQINGIKLSVFLREDTEEKGKIRVSTRSVDDFPCNEMAAEFFNGGGHKNAAGGTLMCGMEEAVEIVRQAIKKYEPLLK